MSHVLLVLFMAAPQQQAARPQDKPSEWSTQWRARGEIAYNSNVFLLDKNPTDTLDQSLASGRYEDMESVDDFVFSPDLRFELKGPSPLGRRLDGWAGLEYPFYFRNSRRSHLELGLGVGHAVGADGHLGLGLGFIPEYFSRNYLSDAIDPANDGVSASERRYEDGVYRQWVLALEYRHKIVDRTSKQPFGMTGIAALGIRDRTYDSPFDGRDEDGRSLSLALRFEYDTKVRWGIRYTYEAIDSPTEQEVLLLDEPDFGVNFNGDLDSTDQNARAFQSVDRSRKESEIGLFVSFAVGQATQLELGYARVRRDFDSGEPFDVSHRGREDTRDEIDIILKFDVAKDWDGRFGLEWREQDTDRSGDPDSTGGTLDYRRLMLILSFAYRF